MPVDSIVVIGAGQAGFSCCSKLRALGYSGDLTLVGEEPQPPYQRPPLSKAYLQGEMSLERLLLRPLPFYEERSIALLTGVRATRIDREAKTVEFSDGQRLRYDRVVLCTGSTPIRLPASLGGDLAGVYYVRNLADADAMAEEFRAGCRALVIGGGYIGLEAAAVAAKNGVRTTLVEAADRILKRVASSETSDWFRDLHRAHGVTILENTSLARLNGRDGRVVGAALSDGTELELDFAVVGIGIRPNQQLAEESGLAVENGIRVNAFCETSDPDILAAGDCASFPYREGRLRLESVGNAIDQAEKAASVIMGDRTPYIAKPWFWSDQYDTKLQIAGLSAGFDEIVARRVDGRTASFWYYSKDRLLAVDAMNDPRAYMVAKRLLDSGRSPDKALLSEPQRDLKSLLEG